MYRKKMIPRVLKVILSESKEKEQIISALKITDASSLICQGCGKSGCMKFHGTYKRGITYEENGQIVDDFVMIPVFFCVFCNYYHAVLTEYLIPFCSYTLSFILKVLRAYSEHTCTIPALCRKWQISRRTLYSWIKRFGSHFSMLKHSNTPSNAAEYSDSTECPDASDVPCTSCHEPSETPENNLLNSSRPLSGCLLISLKLILSFPDLPSTFFTLFNYSFLQGCAKKHLKILPRPG